MLERDRNKINNLLYEMSQGSKAAFAELCDKYYQWFWNYIDARAKNHNLAHDLTQELFVRIALMDLSNIKFEQMSSYILKIAENLIHSDSHKMGDKVNATLPENSVLATVNVYGELPFAEITKTLSETDYEIFDLRYMQGLGVDEIAKKLHKTERTVFRTLDRIKNSVKENVEETVQTAIFLGMLSAVGL